MNGRHRLWPFLALAVGLCLWFAGAAGPALPGLAPQEQRPSEWPKLADKEQVTQEIERLRRATTPEMGESASQALVACGAGCVPLLLPLLGREKDEGAVARIQMVLDQVAEPKYAHLLAREFEDRQDRVRVWALRSAAKALDRELRGAAEKALERARTRGARLDPEECFAAALCALSSGSLLGLDEIRARTAAQWKKDGGAITAAGRGARGPEASKVLAASLAGAAREEIVASLRLLAIMGDASASGAVQPLLDHNDNSLRIGAINALRGMIDGESPLNELPVFEAIELAKQWKARLGSGK